MSQDLYSPQTIILAFIFFILIYALVGKIKGEKKLSIPVHILVIIGNIALTVCLTIITTPLLKAIWPEISPEPNHVASSATSSSSSTSDYYEPVVIKSAPAKALTKAPAPTPVPAPKVVYPSDWDTQFKPGTTEKEYNFEQYKKLHRIDDDNISTMFDWLILFKERTDDIPELTAYFDGKAIGSIGIRNGNLKSAQEYYYYSRATRLTARIYTREGVDRVQINIPDIYTTDYQTFSLGKVYTNVNKIELWLDDFNYDENNTKAGRYIIYIADIQFYDQTV